jgi:hypothetical protein
MRLMYGCFWSYFIMNDEKVQCILGKIHNFMTAGEPTACLLALAAENDRRKPGIQGESEDERLSFRT